MTRVTFLCFAAMLAAGCEGPAATGSTPALVIGTLGLQVENQTVLSPAITIRVQAGSFDTILTARSLCHTVGLMTADEIRPLAVPRGIPVLITPVFRFVGTGIADSATIAAPPIGPDSSFYFLLTLPRFRPTDVEGETFALSSPSRPAGLDSVWVGLMRLHGDAFDKGPCTR